MAPMFSVPFLTSLTNYAEVTPLDDTFDILSCFITAFIYTFFALLISAKSYVGSPIECWLPQTYNNQWAQFSENYCFLKDTYWYPTHEPMGQITITHKEDHRLRYYQWSCMYFAIAAVVCIIPKIFWRLSQNFTDIPILYFCETANKIRNDTAEKRKEKVQEMSELLQTKVVARQHPQFFFTVGPYFVYGFVKWLYLFIAFLQYPAIGIFIGQRSDPFWGWTLARNLYNGITWETTGMFPRITFCDFIVRELAGNNREETVQCVIGINEFNEKIYLFLWFWILFVFFSTFIGCIYTFFNFRRKVLVKRVLNAIPEHNDRKDLVFRLFVDKFLTSDGLLVLHFVKTQSDVVANELATKMYENFLVREQNRRDSNIERDIEKGERNELFKSQTTTCE